MLIFDKFPDQKHADAFAVHVRDTFLRATRVCDSQEKSNQYDLFPFLLQPPIVLVERDSGKRGCLLESQIEEAVKQFGGEFAGT